MKNIWKRTLAILLVVILVGGFTPIMASAETYSGSCGDSAFWRLDPETGVLTISGTGMVTVYTHTAPWDFDYTRPYIKEAVIQSGITSIDRGAFQNHTALKEITIPESLTDIFDWAFNGCTALTDVYYSGTQAQWKAISIGSKNTWLTNATIHFGSDSPSAIIQSGEIVEFGRYPQSEVIDRYLISQLNKVATNWVSYGYYSGTGNWHDGKMKASDFMKYTDVEYPEGSSQYYRGVKFYGYRPSPTGGVLNGSSDSNIKWELMSTYWFAYEPLKWVVLDVDTGLVLSKSIIDEQPYNSFILEDDRIQEDATYLYFSNAEKSHYASDYASSSIRFWLTDERDYCSFFNIAFNNEEQVSIFSTVLDNSSSYAPQFNGVTTKDKVFLLSYSDVINNSYGFNQDRTFEDAARKAARTDYASCQGMEYTFSKPTDWYLRTPGTSLSVCCVYENGYVYDGDYYHYWLIPSSIYGIRPAMCVDLNAVKVCHENQNETVFQESTYIANIWLNQYQTETTAESKLVSDMMDYYSPSSDMYHSLKSDFMFQVAVQDWNIFQFVSDPASGEKKYWNRSDVYESLILDMLEKATSNDVENKYKEFANAMDLVGTSADVVTDFKDAVDRFDTAFNNGSITLDTIKGWEIDPYYDDTWTKFSESFTAAGENNKTPWGETKFVKGLGTIADIASDTSDFYKRLCSYMYACSMQTDMVNFLTEMGKQSLSEHFQTALNHVLNAVNNIDYAQLVCSLELSEDLAWDVLKGVWKDISTLFPVYGFLKTVGDAAVAFDNMFFNTQSIVDKYYLLEATYDFFSATKAVIERTKSRYLSDKTEINAAAYVFAMRTFQYAYEIDLESAVAFAKAADDEGVVNGVKNGALLLSNLITGENQKTDYQTMSDSAESIKTSLASLFYTLDTTWKFYPEYLKKDYPDIYPVYVQEELSKENYTPLIADTYLSPKGTSNIKWYIPFGYSDKDGSYHHMSTYIVDGVEATETTSGSTTRKSSALDDGNGYVVEFTNNSTFTSFPKAYSVKGYSNTESGKVYTGTRTTSFENPLKKPIVGIPSDSQMLTNISSGYTAIGIYDTTQKRYENIKYKIYRRTDSSSWKLLDTIDKTDSFLLHRTIYKDTTATIKQNYYYKVSSYIDFSNGKRLESPESDVVCMRVSDVVNNAMNLVLKPAQTIVHANAPKKAISKAQTNTGTSEGAGIQLTWNTVAGVNGYEIYRLASYGTNYILIDTVFAGTTSYIDENVSNGISYNYVVIPYYSSTADKIYAPQTNGSQSISYSEPSLNSLLLDVDQEIHGEIGQVVNMNLKITNNPRIVALNLAVKYDSELVELVGVSNSGLLRGFNSPNTYSGSSYALNWEDGLATNNNTATGTIATLSFRLKKGFDVTSIVISGKGFDADVNMVSVNEISCKVINTSSSGNPGVQSVSLRAKEKTFYYNGFSAYYDTYPTIVCNGDIPYTVRWYSSNSSVATATPIGDKNVEIHIISPGKAAITCVVTDSLGNVVSDSMVINVLATDIQTFEINEKTIELSLVDGKKQINYTLLTANGATCNIQWISSNDKVVQVDKTGTLIPISAGTATITCTVTDKYNVTRSDTCSVIVTKGRIHSAHFDQRKVALKCGDTCKLQVTVECDPGVDYQINCWAVRNDIPYAESSTVCVVDSTGLITALKPGCAYVYCDVKDEYGHTRSCMCEIRVVQIMLSDATMVYKQQMDLSVQILGDEIGDGRVRFESSDSSVMMRDSSIGRVYAVRRGQSIISCIWEDDDGNKLTQTCTVTVKYAWWQILIRIFLLGFIWY